MQRIGIGCYMSAGTAQALGIKANYHTRTVEPNKLFSIGKRWSVFPFPIQHDAAAPFGFFIAGPEHDNLLYATDTYYLAQRFKQPIHYLMIEANYAPDILRANVERGAIPQVQKNRVLKSHMSIDTLQGILEANNLSQCRGIWLLHLSAANSDAERFRSQVQAWTGIPTEIA